MDNNSSTPQGTPTLAAFGGTDNYTSRPRHRAHPAAALQGELAVRLGEQVEAEGQDGRQAPVGHRPLPGALRALGPRLAVCGEGGGCLL